MDLPDWLARIEQLHPHDIDLGLDRPRPVAERLGVTRLRSTVITVAGTNGKGSTVALMEALARASGISVGCYTSPHIHRFNERIRINGVALSDAVLSDAFARVEQARQDVALTYFEFTTLVALTCFARHAPDLVLLEVGLGGRLDAVNLVDPDVAVVTSIGLDHLDWLGATREAIATEKCGIARAGKPLVFGERDRPDTVDQSCETAGASLVAAGTDFGVRHGRLYWAGQASEDVAVNTEIPLGPDNLASALQALVLAGVELPDRPVRVASRTHLAGRNQRIALDGVNWIFDVGHNAEAIRRLAANLGHADGQTHVVLGMMKDKSLEQSLAELSPVADHWYLLDLPGPRGATAESLAIHLPSARPEQHCFHDVAPLLDAVQGHCRAGDQVLVVGSFVTVDLVAKALDLDLLQQITDSAGIPGQERTQ